MKSHGEGSDRLRHQFRHQRDVRRRINSAGKKHSERHVCHHSFFDRVPQQSENFFLMFFFALLEHSGRRQSIPILRQANFTAAINNKQVTRGNLLYTFKERLGRWRGYKSQIMIERFFIDFCRDRGMFEDGFDFRSKNEAPILLSEIQRLYAGPIARKHEAVAIGVPKRDGVIAFDVIYKVEPALFVKMQNRFRVSAR